MPQEVPFEQVLHLLQEHGWELTGISKPYRVFKKPGHALPILIPVHDKMVDIEYVERIKKIIQGEYEEGAS